MMARLALFRQWSSTVSYFPKVFVITIVDDRERHESRTKRSHFVQYSEYPLSFQSKLSRTNFYILWPMNNVQQLARKAIATRCPNELKRSSRTSISLLYAVIVALANKVNYFVLLSPGCCMLLAFHEAPVSSFTMVFLQ